MPFIASDLSALSAANGFTLWHYRTSDSRADTEAPGYFTPGADRLRVGDIILVQASDGTTMLPIRAEFDRYCGGFGCERSPAHDPTFGQPALPVDPYRECRGTGHHL